VTDSTRQPRREGGALSPPEELKLGPRFQEALAYAAQVHASQFRKGTSIPYIAHPLSVAALVLTDNGTEDEAIAALLHDAAEDQGGKERLADIRERFAERVADIVEACSDALETPKPPWRPRKEAYLERLRSEADEGVLRVELADKLDNARAILRDLIGLGDQLWERFSASRESQLWYYRGLANTFKGRLDSPMVRQLEETVAEIESLA
jgi:(p)ppGpp synthase/HD superfamily hydrolase